MKTKLAESKLSLCILILFLLLCTSNLRSEEYVISFNASGASTTVTTVKVENMSLCKDLTMDGSKNLRLIVTAMGIELPFGDTNKGISFYPNPMTEFSRMQFNLSESGKTSVSLYDISGREVARTENYLPAGSHKYRIEGVENGLYFVRINSGVFHAADV